MHKSKSDADPIPAWALDPEAAYPCPCGEPMMGNFVVMKGGDGLVRLFHQECIQEYMEIRGEDGEEI